MSEALLRVIRNVAQFRPEFVLCHGALNKLGEGFGGGANVIRALLDELGPEYTVAVPSFAFSTNVDYANYVSKPIRFDAVRSPSRVSLLGELFRRRPEAQRSCVPIYPLTAIGPRASEILSEDHLDPMPFGPRTAFAKMSRMHTFVLGLGVDVNTCGFVHLIDDPYIDELGLPIYSASPVTGEYFVDGVPRGVGEYYYVLPEARRHIRPGNLHPLLIEKPWYLHGTSPFPHYALDVRKFIDFGCRHVESALTAEELPIWHPAEVNGVVRKPRADRRRRSA